MEEEKYVIPLVKEIISIDDTDDEIVKVKLRFHSFKDMNGNYQNGVYCIVAYPKRTGEYPGILYLHGGTLNAESYAGRVYKAARQGYIAAAPEIPYIATPTENSQGEWTKKPYLSDVFIDSVNPADSSMIEAIVAIRDAFCLLEAGRLTWADNETLSSDVRIDSTNLGISGLSWGGYLTLMLASIVGDKIKAVFSDFGCGFYDLTPYWDKKWAGMSNENKKVWLDNFDVGRKVKNITAPVFITTPTNDWYYSPVSAMETLKNVGSQHKGIVFSPNSHHEINVPGGTGVPIGCAMQEVYFDYYLKGKGSPFPRVSLENISYDGKKYNLTLQVDHETENPITILELWGADNGTDYKSRKWEKIETRVNEYSGGMYKVEITAYAELANMELFFLVSDSRNVSASSNMFLLRRG